MYVHSAWVHGAVGDDVLDAVAGEMGADPEDMFTSPHGRLVPIPLPFSHDRESPWETSTTTGTWNGAIVVPRSDDFSSPADDRIVGVVCPSPALLADLVDSFVETLEDRRIGVNPVEFSLRQLLSVREKGVAVRSVRLAHRGVTTLVRGEDPGELREVLALLQGEVVGLTLTVGEQTLSIVSGGSVVFVEPDARSVLRTMGVLAETLVARALA